jgi:hypothetical protein
VLPAQPHHFEVLPLPPRLHRRLLPPPAGLCPGRQGRGRGRDRGGRRPRAGRAERQGKCQDVVPRRRPLATPLSSRQRQPGHAIRLPMSEFAEHFPPVQRG